MKASLTLAGVSRVSQSMLLRQVGVIVAVSVIAWAALQAVAKTGPKPGANVTADNPTEQKVKSLGTRATPPANDKCSDAIPITSASLTITQDTLGATSTGDPIPSCQPSFGRGVWYRYTPSMNGTISVNTAGSSFDTVLAVYSGSCGSLSSLACNDDSGTAFTSRIENLAVKAGVTYFILAGGFSGEGGRLTLTFSFRPTLTVTRINPDWGYNTQPITTTITGTGFVNGATTKLARSGMSDIPGTNVVWVSATQMTCTFDITGKTTGQWDVVVKNPDGVTATLAKGFTIASPGMAIYSITPSVGFNTGTAEISNLCGSGFLPGATVKLARTGQNDIMATSVVVVNPTRITCVFDLTGQPEGYWNVVVRNPDGRTAILQNGFRIVAPIIGNDSCTGALPILEVPYQNEQDTSNSIDTDDPSPSCQPVCSKGVWYRFSSMDPGRMLVNTIGSNFDTVLSVYAGACGSTTLSEVACDDDGGTNYTSLIDSVSIASGTTYYILAGGYQGKSGRLVFNADFAYAPVVTYVSPTDTVNSGVVNITNLVGRHFASGATVRLTLDGQPDIEATNVFVMNPNRITCSFDVTGARAGAWDLVVTNPDGQSGVLEDIFNIRYPVPAIDTVAPDTGLNKGYPLSVSIYGSGFVLEKGSASPTPSVALTKEGEGDIIAQNVQYIRSTKLTCKLPLDGATPGLWNVVVTNPDGQRGIKENAFTVTGSLSQPDLMIKNEMEPDSEYALDNVYQKVPSASQTKTQTVGQEITARFYVQVQNDGNEPKKFILKATGVSNSQWAISYRKGTDITSQITSSGGITTTVLLPGNSETIIVEMKPLVTASEGSSATTTIEAYLSGSDTQARDSVKAVTQVLDIQQQERRPDLLIRNDGVGSVYQIDGNPATGYKGYQTEPTGEQINLQYVPRERTATFYVKVENDSPTITARTFVVKAKESNEGGWSVRYSTGGSDISGQVTGVLGYTTRSLRQGESEIITIQMTPNASVPVGTQKSTDLKVYIDTTDLTPRDAVRAKTIVAVELFNISGSITCNGIGLPGVAVGTAKISLAQLSQTTQPELPDGGRIPDGNVRGVSSPVTITATGIVKDIQVSVDITHPRPSDLVIWLEHPNGTTVGLQRHAEGEGENVVTTYPHPTEPVQPFTPLIGEPIEGVWRLWVRDTVATNQGALNSWTLTLTYEFAGGGYITQTSVYGNYALNNLPAGTYTIIPSKPGYAFEPPSQQVIGGPSQVGVNFTAYRAQPDLQIRKEGDAQYTGSGQWAPEFDCGDQATTKTVNVAEKAVFQVKLVNTSTVPATYTVKSEASANLDWRVTYSTNGTDITDKVKSANGYDWPAEQGGNKIIHMEVTPSRTVGCGSRYSVALKVYNELSTTAADCVVAVTELPSPPAPTVTSISPTTGVNTDVVLVTLTGTGFTSQGLVVKLTRTGQPDILATDIVAPTSTTMTCRFDLFGAVPGPRDVQVVNQCGQKGSLDNAFMVTGLGADLTLTDLTASPNPVSRGQTVTFAFTVRNIGGVVVKNVGVQLYANERNVGPPQTIGTLVPGQQVSRSLRIKIPARIRPDTYHVKAEAQPVQGDISPGNNSQVLWLTVQ